jgi:magnesium-transporting ATPase (P-type)
MDMALLVFANDFATMSLLTDNAEPSLSPRKWNVKNLVTSSLSIGIALLIEALIAIYIGLRVFNLSEGRMQTFILLTLVFTSQFRVLMLRERKWFWSSRPGRELTASIIGVTIAFLALGALGVYCGEPFYFVSDGPITILCLRCLEEASSREELVELRALARAFAECVRDLGRREKGWKVPI